LGSSFFLWAALAALVYTSCVLRGALRFFNKYFLLIKKNNKKKRKKESKGFSYKVISKIVTLVI